MFLSFFVISFYVRFKSSDFLYKNKYLGIFLIWFSRTLSYFAIYHYVDILFPSFISYTLVVLGLFSIYKLWNERIFLLHSYTLDTQSIYKDTISLT
jgi:hypothetical protein